MALLSSTSSFQAGKTESTGDSTRATPALGLDERDEAEGNDTVGLSSDRRLRRLPRRSLRMVGNWLADPNAGGHPSSSLSIAMVYEELGDEGADDECVRANEARDVGKGWRGDGTGEAMGSVISRSLGVLGRRIGRDIVNEVV